VISSSEELVSCRAVVVGSKVCILRDRKKEVWSAVQNNACFSTTVVELGRSAQSGVAAAQLPEKL
jgi:hypothetical protein